MRYVFLLRSILHLRRNALKRTSSYLKESEPGLIRNWLLHLHVKWKLQFTANVWRTSWIQRFEGDVLMEKTVRSILIRINVNSLYLLLKSASRQHQLTLKWLTILKLQRTNLQRTTGCRASIGKLQGVPPSTSH